MVPTPSPSPVVYSMCPLGQYWALGAAACRGPSYPGECFNPATAMFQNGCAPGFSCQNNKCNTIPPATFPSNVCYVKCATSDQYCENGTTKCRGPNFQGECFNPATGFFQSSCDSGFSCANNLCCFLIPEFAPSHAPPPPTALKMKLTALLSAIAVTKLGLLQSVSAQTFDGNSTDSSTGDCYLPCEGFGEYCEISTGECRGPNYASECFNPATGAFQDGCDPGFDCVDSKCDFVDTVAPDSGTSVCAQQCAVFGEYCDAIIDECRGPNYDGECFNPVLGYFQNGCQPGYTCQRNQCELMAAEPSTSVCYLQCETGEYCENGTDMCRGPNYDGECFNPATGAFQDSCDPGFICVDNECTYA
ncbi:hypothetical protein BBJ28_00004177 [Nothophytophthora sp. Chile5]|nr:hypothetical protein BBJ28_00004177 [Nothophytophthora sp. Chile5]